jgi:hypothetical protein
MTNKIVELTKELIRDMEIEEVWNVNVKGYSTSPSQVVLPVRGYFMHGLGKVVIPHIRQNCDQLDQLHD